MKTVPNDLLVESFIRGQRRGESHSMEVQQIAAGVTVLKSYDAIIAMRDRFKSRYIIFDGWKGYSHTTSSHINLLMDKVTETDGWSVTLNAERPATSEIGDYHIDGLLNSHVL